MTIEITAAAVLDNLLCRKDLIIGNPNSNVGICTLWTQRQLIANRLDARHYFICANLYSFAGINYLLRNILQFPQIRYLIICGADQSQTGDALSALFTATNLDSHNLPGTQTALDTAIPLTAIEQIRQNVQLVDLRPVKSGLKSPEAITNHLNQLLPTLDCLEPFAPPQTFAENALAGGKPLPNEGSGFRVEGRTVAETWLDLLRLVMRFGQIKPTEYTQQQRELFNTVAVITEEDPDDIFFAPWLPFARESLENYYPYMLNREKPAGVSYTYGERLRNFGQLQLDQIERMKDRLRETLYTRRAVAVTWQAEQDSISTNPPCLLEVAAGVQNNQLFLTARFRSHDIFTAWPQNTFALRHLQKELAEAVKLKMGSLTIISQSAHIYEDKWGVALDTVASFEKKKWEWRSDPRGYFVISIQPDKGLITAQHSTLEGFSPFYFEGTSARQLCLQISQEKLAALDEHYAYLGRELMKAEIALKLGLSYTQDKELDFSK